jgi:hypothetical protein
MMKKLLYISFFFSLILQGCSSSGQISDGYGGYQNNYGGEVSYQTFYDQLQPYGRWIDYPNYGYVWVPDGMAGFRPYETGGHWVPTVDGWAWASDYSWGWAPFHYGRWMFDPALGWAWVPGYEWAPAWVTWGQYDNYYAWAPLAPGISIGFGNTWRAPANYWSFVPRSYINYTDLHRFVARNNYNVNNITIINNYNSYNNKNYYRGPDYKEVQQYTHRPVREVAIASAPRPGAAKVNSRAMEVYRPAVVASASAGRPMAPARVQTIDQIRPNNAGRANTMNSNGDVNIDKRGGFNNRGDNSINQNGSNQNNSYRAPERPYYPQRDNNTSANNAAAIDAGRQMNRNVPVQPQADRPVQTQPSNPQNNNSTQRPDPRSYGNRPYINESSNVQAEIQQRVDERRAISRPVQTPNSMPTPQQPVYQNQNQDNNQRLQEIRRQNDQIFNRQQPSSSFPQRMESRPMPQMPQRSMGTPAPSAPVQRPTNDNRRYRQ